MESVQLEHENVTKLVLVTLRDGVEEGRGFSNAKKDPMTSKELNEEPYEVKISCILSGAVWANEAWGSYWNWDPMDEDMVSLDPIEFHSEEEPYKDRIDSYQRKTGLTEAVQTGIGQLNGIPVAIGVMDFQFMGGSMGSVVGEKITRLIEYISSDFKSRG
ncbi:hypothetical protein RJ640_012572 [Escallonia rubra]|uniref:CoA carboxyltransferase N-terminal domain-containing protein n=1 Tax=Escallonia rubra TaxID=112253 RepID=A0AA88TXZ5_9ASTE|nr:hypothetical protein RJ640_012572 [Escallonia rubra]